MCLAARLPMACRLNLRSIPLPSAPCCCFVRHASSNSQAGVIPSSAPHTTCRQVVDRHLPSCLGPHTHVTHIHIYMYLHTEILKNLDHGPEVDWWALGVLIFELLVGDLPFKSLYLPPPFPPSPHPLPFAAHSNLGSGTVSRIHSTFSASQASARLLLAQHQHSAGYGLQHLRNLPKLRQGSESSLTLPSSGPITTVPPPHSLHARWRSPFAYPLQCRPVAAPTPPPPRCPRRSRGLVCAPLPTHAHTHNTLTHAPR